MNPIGFVKTTASRDRIKKRMHLSQIVLCSDFVDALSGLDEFSHIFVIFWLHKVSAQDRKTLKVRPQRRSELPLLGAFATRTQLRPNPIGLTIAELMQVRCNVVTVRGLDAYNGTPVLDLKPVDPWRVHELQLKLRVPDWWTQLEHERTASGTRRGLD